MIIIIWQVTCLELLAFQRAVLNASSPDPSPDHHDDDDGNDDDADDYDEDDDDLGDDNDHDQYQNSVLLF